MTQPAASIRHILFPFDFSPRAHQVAPFVAALAARAAARVTLLSVLPPTFDRMPADMGDLRAGDDAATWVANLQTRLNGQLADEFRSLTTDRVAVSGDPALRIIEYANCEGVDLIMMPTHGLGVFRTLLIGSVTAKVLHDATCPVWTAAHAETQTAQPNPRAIVCAVDGSDATVSLIRWAIDFGNLTGATLSVVRVVDPVTDWPSLASEQRVQEQVRLEAQREIEAVLSHARITVPFRVPVGRIVETVVSEATTENADLIVVGRGTLAEPFGRLRTHAFGIIQSAPCPVISV